MIPKVLFKRVRLTSRLWKNAAHETLLLQVMYNSFETNNYKLLRTFLTPSCVDEEGMVLLRTEMLTFRKQACRIVVYEPKVNYRMQNLFAGLRNCNK